MLAEVQAMPLEDRVEEITPHPRYHIRQTKLSSALLRRLRFSTHSYIGYLIGRPFQQFGTPSLIPISRLLHTIALHFFIIRDRFSGIDKNSSTALVVPCCFVSKVLEAPYGPPSPRHGCVHRSAPRCDSRTPHTRLRSQLDRPSQKLHYYRNG